VAARRGMATETRRQRLGLAAPRRLRGAGGAVSRETLRGEDLVQLDVRWRRLGFVTFLEAS
jgi:hypothetical protein